MDEWIACPWCGKGIMVRSGGIGPIGTSDPPPGPILADAMGDGRVFPEKGDECPLSAKPQEEDCS